jgi:hypothetical protein
MCRFFKFFIFKGGFHEISADFGKPNVKSTTCKKNLHMGLVVAFRSKVLGRILTLRRESMKSPNQMPFVIGAMIVLTLFFALPATPTIAFETQQVDTPDDCVTVVDALGAATTQSKFFLEGSSGTSILPTQFIGPQFTLTESAVLSEISWQTERKRAADGNGI